MLGWATISDKSGSQGHRIAKARLGGSKRGTVTFKQLTTSSYLRHIKDMQASLLHDDYLLNNDLIKYLNTVDLEKFTTKTFLIGIRKN